MVDNYKILTLTFSDAHLEELADYLISSGDPEGEGEKLHDLKKKLEVDELYYLNTCNRVLYLFYTNKTIAQLNEELATILKVRTSQNITRPGLKEYTGEYAIRHFFEVASSLKSMVIGEQEILRQVKEAYERGRQEGISGDQIRILFQSALQTAKAVHHKTRISERTVSVVSLAMKKLRRLGIHQDDEVILIGAGETMQKVVKFLREWRMTRVKVFNRSMGNLGMINKIMPGIDSYLLDELHDHNLNVPFIISCTGHNNYILTPELVEKITHGQGLTETRGVLDLAVPRDVHPDIIKDYELKVIEVESLRNVAEKNKAFRMREVAMAEEIVEDEVNSFKEKVHRRFIEKAFQEIPAKIYATRDRALQEVYKSQIEDLDPDGQELVKEMMDYMARKCISIPMKTARKQYMAIRKEMRHYQPDSNAERNKKS